MSNSTIVISGGQPVAAAKMFWEDPCLTLERNLEVRAQGGPPGDGPQFGTMGFLGPMSASNKVCENN